MNAKQLFLKAMAIVICFLSQHSVEALSQKTSMDDGGTPILISQSSNTIPGGPRTAVPFFASLLNDSVYLGCIENIGSVTVEVSSTAGDWAIVPFDTSCGSIVIPVSGEEGRYSLTITTAGGTMYEGGFTI